MMIYLSGPTLPFNNIAISILSYYDWPHLSSHDKKYVRIVSSHTLCLSPPKKNRTAISACAGVRTGISSLSVGNDRNSLRKI
jgi:hypothetical protein